MITNDFGTIGSYPVEKTYPYYHDHMWYCSDGWGFSSEEYAREHQRTSCPIVTNKLGGTTNSLTEEPFVYRENYL